MSKKVLILSLLLSLLIGITGCGEKASADGECAMSGNQFAMRLLESEYNYQLFKRSNEKSNAGNVYYARATGMPTVIWMQYAGEADTEEAGESLLGFTESGLEIYGQAYFYEFANKKEAEAEYEILVTKLKETQKDTIVKEEKKAYAYCDYNGYFKRYYMVVSWMGNTVLVVQIPEEWMEQTEKLFQGTEYETIFAEGEEKNE